MSTWSYSDCHLPYIENLSGLDMYWMTWSYYLKIALSKRVLRELKTFWAKRASQDTLVHKRLGCRIKIPSIIYCEFCNRTRILGNYPAASHLINILLYAFTACLIFRLFQLFNISKPDSPWYLALPFIGALLFVAHPIHSEAIANIKGRDEILCLLFAIAALISWIRYYDTKSKVHAGASMVWFCLALFSKENAVTFVLIIPLTIYF